MDVLSTERPLSRWMDEGDVCSAFHVIKFTLLESEAGSLFLEHASLLHFQMQYFYLQRQCRSISPNSCCCSSSWGDEVQKMTILDHLK